MPQCQLLAFTTTVKFMCAWTLKTSFSSPTVVRYTACGFDIHMAFWITEACDLESPSQQYSHEQD